ncbi:hypothetical protein PGTUg99_027038 [Puccinia graminis f. sp. tritici]|uniref:Uncharacterized protein n=1 Tax=Puccinia graminis f. sp. tritici TaxID=56615 RepID=A0A5B0RH64_PUCGR|nr:hypothetical protein PGTUg99_027038 [Puccinia graminis f. sp. tritici]
MLKLTLLASLLSIASLQTVSARQAPPLLAKRGVIGVDVNFCPHWDKLEACRGGSHACCRQFCASYRVSIETEAATQFCNPGNAPKKPDPSPPPPPPPPPPRSLPATPTTSDRASRSSPNRHRHRPSSSASDRLLRPARSPSLVFPAGALCSCTGARPISLNSPVPLRPQSPRS